MLPFVYTPFCASPSQSEGAQQRKNVVDFKAPSHGRVGSMDVSFRLEKTAPNASDFPPLQKTQGWGTLFRGALLENRGVGHPPPFPKTEGWPTRPNIPKALLQTMDNAGLALRSTTQYGESELRSTSCPKLRLILFVSFSLYNSFQRV